MDINSAVERLFERTAHGIRPGLEVITALLEELGNPHQRMAVVHVAGTNGKGSVCAMIESVLRASGFKTGLYTSPHLIRFSERFRLSGVEIPEKTLETYIHRVEEAAERLEAHSGLRPATFFELSTAIAFQYFADEQVDIAVIETGMGGRWDATNVVIPLVSVITSIDIDHTQFLGSTLEAIASEKAGILKEGRPAVSAPQDDRVMKVLEQSGIPILHSDESVSVATSRGSHKIRIETASQTLPPIQLPLLGACQRNNCAVAVAALEVIGQLLSFEPAFKKGLEQTEWKGRFQLLNQHPVTILDGAHNPSAARALLAGLNEYYPGYEVGFILGFLEDKAAHTFVQEIRSRASCVWTIPIDAPRGMDAEEAALQVRSAGLAATPMKADEVWPVACDWAGAATHRILCITGSLYLAAWAEPMRSRTERSTS